MMNERLEKAVDYLQLGKFVVLQDSEDRENEADLVASPIDLDPYKVGFMLGNNAGGEFCVPMTPDRIEYLGLKPLEKINSNHDGCNMCIPVDPIGGGSGVDMHDRAKVVYYLTNGYEGMNIHRETSKLKTPGHTFPLKGHKDGILGRQGHTEGSLELMKIAGLRCKSGGYAAVISELMYKGMAMDRERVDKLVRKHDLAYVTIDDIFNYVKSGK